MDDASKQAPRTFALLVAARAVQTRERLERVLASDAMITVIGVAATGNELVELARQSVADIAIVELPLPDLTARRLLRDLKHYNPSLKVILHADPKDEDLWRLVRLGLRGIITAQHDATAIIERIWAVAAGRLALPFLDDARLDQEPTHPLSKRDQELLFAITNNWKTPEISAWMNVSKNTVRYHLKNLYDRLGVSNRSGASAFARERLRLLEGFDSSPGPVVKGLCASQMLSDKRLLIVEDDRLFAERLAKAMESRGFECSVASSAPEAIALMSDDPPAFAVVDMRLKKGNGLQVVAALASLRPDARSIVLTGFGNLANAVSAMRLGAFDYLAKPVDADQLTYAFLNTPSSMAPADKVMSVQRIKWEHVHRIHELCHRNVSETARRLAMHRRTLQRMLSKHAPK